MSNIGIDIRNIGKYRTGDEVVFFNLVKNLAVIDANNDYKLFTDIADAETLKSIKKSLEIENKSNFEIISLPAANKFTWNFWTLPRYLQKNEVDTYLTQYITPFFVPKRIKIITIIHDVSFKVYKQFIKFSDLFFLNILIPRSLKRADKIIAVSQFTRDEIIKLYKIDADKVEWIHNAVAGDFLSADLSEEKLKKVREKYKLPDKYILYLGTLQPRKNIPMLIEAFSVSKVEPWKLVIAGGKSHNFDPKIDEMVEKYNLQDKVVFPGFIDEEDKAAVMKAANIFCFPSFYEGFGIPILEAMSVGTPVIASNIAPHKEIAEYAILYFDPESSQELADRINSLVGNDNLRRELIQKGLEQVKKFSWEKTARKMIGIFEGMK
ncbi:MAG: glycosyltransferase family 1 protein [Parcubacteria group bacterium]|jgi:glycosyltransferase involved in cell wall biosynthesis